MVRKIISAKIVTPEEHLKDCVDTGEKNPAHICMGCDKYLGHRGFCSKKCHDNWYDEQYK